MYKRSNSQHPAELNAANKKEKRNVIGVNRFTFIVSISPGLGIYLFFRFLRICVMFVAILSFVSGLQRGDDVRMRVCVMYVCVYVVMYC